MCEFCNITTYPETYYSDNEKMKTLIETKYVGLEIIYRKDNQEFLLQASGEDTVYKQIYYCPFCGRKLNNEDKNK